MNSQIQHLYPGALVVYDDGSISILICRKFFPKEKYYISGDATGFIVTWLTQLNLIEAFHYASREFEKIE